MKRFSFHSTKMFAVVISASGILLSASMTHAEEFRPLIHEVNATICQTMHASKTQAKYSPSGVLFNDDENNVLKVVCPLELSTNARGLTRVRALGVSYTGGNSTKALRCRVGIRDSLTNNNLRTSYQTGIATAKSKLVFAGQEFESIMNQSGFPYLYCEIPQKSSSLSYISGIYWSERVIYSP